MEKLHRVGPKPKVYLVPAHNDMSHFTPSEYVCNEFYYVEDALYKKLLEFTDPTIMKAPQGMKFGNLAEIMESDFAKRMRDAIDMNPSKSILWQFNAIARNGRDLVRQVVALGEPAMFHEWTDYEANWLLPYQELKVKVLNKLIEGRRKKEQADWDRKLKEFYASRER